MKEKPGGSGLPCPVLLRPWAESQRPGLRGADSPTPGLWGAALILAAFLVLAWGFHHGARAQSEGDSSMLEKKFIEAGLVDVRQIDPSIRVELKYSTTDNFLQADVYGDLDKCYLREEAAHKLAAAQRDLRRLKPGHSLLVYDGARPLSVQRAMWDLVAGTKLRPYVADPARRSIHNYGVAVDLTITDPRGRPLDMGTEFDHFGQLAEPRKELMLLREGLLSPTQVENRRLLRKIMEQNGFSGISTEWWHFDAFPRKVVREKFTVLE